MFGPLQLYQFIPRSLKGEIQDAFEAELRRMRRKMPHARRWQLIALSQCASRCQLSCR